MAETSKILTPEKTVVVPDLEAGCSLADGCPAPFFAEWLRKYPGHTVVSYINCSAAVKALSDVIVTSSSAEAILRQLPDPIVFAPDKNLAAWLEKKLGPQVRRLAGDVRRPRDVLREADPRPDGEEPAGPPRRPPRVRRADPRPRPLRRVDLRAPRSTWRNRSTPPSSSRRRRGSSTRCIAPRPGKELIPAPPDDGCSCNACPHMKRNTMEKLWLALERPPPGDRGGGGGPGPGEAVARPDARADGGEDVRSRARALVTLETVVTGRARPPRPRIPWAPLVAGLVVLAAGAVAAHRVLPEWQPLGVSKEAALQTAREEMAAAGATLLVAEGEGAERARELRARAGLPPARPGGAGVARPPRRARVVGRVGGPSRPGRRDGTGRDRDRPRRDAPARRVHERERLPRRGADGRARGGARALRRGRPRAPRPRRLRSAPRPTSRAGTRSSASTRSRRAARARARSSRASRRRRRC